MRTVVEKLAGDAVAKMFIHREILVFGVYGGNMSTGLPDETFRLGQHRLADTMATFVGDHGQTTNPPTSGLIGMVEIRVYPDLDHADQPGRWGIGRLAVVADERGHGIGKTVLAEAERLIRKAGGHVAAVHSEDKNFAMYEHLGYRITSELFDNGTHGWLVKALN